jgi:hypothetical protein
LNRREFILRLKGPFRGYSLGLANCDSQSFDGRCDADVFCYPYLREKIRPIPSSYQRPTMRSLHAQNICFSIAPFLELALHGVES